MRREGPVCLFSPPVTNSVSLEFDVRAAGRTQGAIDAFDYVDAYAGQTPHLRAYRVPLGAPIVVGGWSLDPSGQPCSQITVVIDLALRFTAKAGFSRRDVVVANGPKTPEFTGFRSILATDALTVGPHEVRAYGLASDGAWYEVGYQAFWLFDIMRPELGVVEPPAHIVVDYIDDLLETGERNGMDTPVPMGDIALIRGWAIDLGTLRAPAGVCALDETGQSWSSGCDLVRPDVRGILPAVNDDRLGFEIGVPTELLGRGRHRVQIVAYNDEGRPLARPLGIVLDIASPIRSFPAYARKLQGDPHCSVLLRRAGGNAVVLDAWSAVTAKRGEVLDILGWAMAPDGGAATGVFLELHHSGLRIPPFRYFPLSGFRRNSTPRELRTPAADDAWFSYQLGTKDLGFRSFDLTLAIVSDDRLSYRRQSLGTLTIVDRDRWRDDED